MASNNKDVIYLDPDDDITAVIDKVKASSAKIIALVPPKRANMLGSVVNLRLLKRTSESVNKKVVLITAEQVLMNMAGGIGMFVAQDLNSPPKIPKVEEIELPSDVIQADATESVGPDDAVAEDGIDVAENAKTPVGDLTSAPKLAAASKPAKGGKPNKNTKIPDIKRFRKKIFIGVGIFVALVLVWWWAFFVAPSASLILYGQTDELSVDDVVVLDSSEGAKFDDNQNILPAIKREISEEQTVDFDATGEEDIGKEATSIVRLSRQSQGTTTIPAGTRLTAGNGRVFVTDEVAIIPASPATLDCFPQVCPGEVEVGITASEKGKEYNGISGNMSGAGGGVSATILSPTRGGSSKIVTVVSDEDVDSAKQELKDDNKSAKLDELKKQFDNEDLLIIEGSFKADAGKPNIEPAVGKEAKKATLTSTVKYSLLAVEKSDYEKLIDVLVEDDLVDGKKVVDYGVDDVKFEASEGFRYNLVASPIAGPDIDLPSLKDEIKGKRFSEAVTIAEAKRGITKVDLKLQPFWVFTVPGNTDKISIKIESSKN